MAVSIYDVAQEAGVSIATVSKVLNETVGGRVGPATRDRVLRIARQCGYQPNRLAQSLVRQTSDTIGLMVSGLQNPFFVSIAEEIEKELFATGHQVMLDAAPSEFGSYQQHAKLRGWPVDGIIMWAFQTQTTEQFLGPGAASLPVVYIGYPRADDAAWIAFDLYGGGRQAADHLVDEGHERITFVTPYVDNEGIVNDPRYLGAQDACHDRGAVIDLFVVQGWRSTRMAALEAGLQIAAMPASVRPKALFCNHDIIALGVYHGLRRSGLSVPGDIAIVGFDGIEEGRCQDIPLTTISCAIDILAQKAVEVLIARMKKNIDGVNQQVLVPTQLWTGGTSCK